jgi:1-acyl-sn-glycerol-3-phosphate acyltransferase
MGPLKSGAFLIAARAGAQVVPCRVLYQSGMPRLFGKVRVIIGTPLSVKELGLAGDWEGAPPAGALRQARNLCAQRMEELRAAHIRTVKQVEK